MNWKKIGKALLFPHIAIMIILVPVATVFLVSSMVFIGTESLIAIISYVLASYTLTVWGFKAPNIIKLFKDFKSKNKLAIRWKTDTRLRVNATLYGSLIWNSLYGVFQLFLGFFHHTFWFYSFGVYYICLAVMRFFLLLHTRKYDPGVKMHSELQKYRACGWIFLLMNLALALIVFFMVYWNRTFEHHMITTIAMATYTFTSFTVAIVNVFKYKKYKSPVFSASKAISLASALVSMLTLESTMLTTFSAETMTAVEQKLMLGITGCVISLLIVTMAIYMIVIGTKKLKQLKQEVKNGK